MNSVGYIKLGDQQIGKYARNITGDKLKFQQDNANEFL